MTGSHDGTGSVKELKKHHLGHLSPNPKNLFERLIRDGSRCSLVWLRNSLFELWTPSKPVKGSLKEFFASVCLHDTDEWQGTELEQVVARTSWEYGFVRMFALSRYQTHAVSPDVGMCDPLKSADTRQVGTSTRLSRTWPSSEWLGVYCSPPANCQLTSDQVTFANFCFWFKDGFPFSLWRANCKKKHKDTKENVHLCSVWDQLSCTSCFHPSHLVLSRFNWL